jgi:hypothetical protein
VLKAVDKRESLPMIRKPGEEFSIKGLQELYDVTDGKTLITATDWWIHESFVNDDRMIPKASRLLPGSWTGAYRFSDEQGDKLQVAVRVTGDSIKIITVRFDIPDASPIQGDPKELLAGWQKKLALELKEDGKIELMYPIELQTEDYKLKKFRNTKMVR